MARLARVECLGRMSLQSGCAGFSVFGGQFSENRSSPPLVPFTLGMW